MSVRCGFSAAVVFVFGTTVSAQSPRPADSPDSARTVAVFVNGARLTDPGVLHPTDVVELTNGRLRLTRDAASLEQRAGIVVTLASATGLVAGTAAEYGDYTYVGGDVRTEPTGIDVLQLSSREVVVKWTFGNHQVPTRIVGSAKYGATPYPFEKTVWLRVGEPGYYALIRPLIGLPESADRFEHEIGFGGLWGDAVVRSREGEVAVGTLTQHRILNLEKELDAAVLLRSGDIVKRVIVPIPLNSMIIPNWGEVRGGVWTYSYVSEPYGAYLYFNASGASFDISSVCARAVREAPPEMRPPGFDAASLERCGRRTPRP